MNSPYLTLEFYKSALQKEEMNLCACVCIHSVLPVNRRFAEEGLCPPASAALSSSTGVVMNVRKCIKHWKLHRTISWSKCWCLEVWVAFRKHLKCNREWTKITNMELKWSYNVGYGSQDKGIWSNSILKARIALAKQSGCLTLSNLFKYSTWCTAITFFAVHPLFNRLSSSQVTEDKSDKNP